MDEVRALAGTLPRATEVFVRGRIKFRVGRIVFLSFSRDGTLMGFGFPKEWREALVESEPEKFMLPRASDLRFNWAVVRLAEIDEEEMRDLVLEAWAMVVPQKVSAAYRDHALRPARGRRPGRQRYIEPGESPDEVELSLVVEMPVGVATCHVNALPSKLSAKPLPVTTPLSGSSMNR